MGKMKELWAELNEAIECAAWTALDEETVEGTFDGWTITVGVEPGSQELAGVARGPVAPGTSHSLTPEQARRAFALAQAS